MNDTNDMIHYTPVTEKAALLKAVGYEVSIHDESNPYKVIWKCKGEVNGVTVKEASRKIHLSIPLGKIIDLPPDRFCLEKFRPALKELMGRIAEIKREAEEKKKGGVR